MDLETAITTQEQLNDVIGERLKRQEDKIRKSYDGYISPEDYATSKGDFEAKINSLTEENNSYKKKIAEHDELVNGLNAKIKGYETSSVKQRIAHEAGLPYEMASRLNGETEEEIKADAETFKSLFASKKPAAPLRSDDPDKIDDSRAALKNMLSKMTSN